jgi:hypothetical protein
VAVNVSTRIEVQRSPGRIAGLLARLRCHSIDTRLLAGESAGDSDEAAARFRQLVAPKHRSRIASELRHLLQAARAPERRWPGIPVRAREILRSEPLILTLADELEELEDVNPRGVILTSRLLHDGRSPVFWKRSEMELDRAVKHARAALHLG